MDTIGKLLKHLREKEHISLESVSKKTKIAAHLLEYLEADDYPHLPSSTFTKGFIAKYAEVVGLPPAKALAIFRRDFTVSESGKILPKGLAKPLDKPTVVTSKVIIIACVALFVLLFAGYLGFQLKNYQSAPTLNIVRPKPNSLVKGPTIAIKGFASAGSSVYVNGAVVEIFPTGEFQAVTQLPAGEHDIVIKAVSSQNKTTEQRIPITVVDK